MSHYELLLVSDAVNNSKVGSLVFQSELGWVTPLLSGVERAPDSAPQLTIQPAHVRQGLPEVVAQCLMMDQHPVQGFQFVVYWQGKGADGSALEEILSLNSF